MQRRFPLATVLLLREQSEAAAERALAATSAELRRINDAVVHKQQQMVEHGRNRDVMLRKVLPAVEHQRAAAQWQLLRQQLDELKRLQAGAEAHRDLQRQRYVQARRDRESFARLEQQHAQQWAAWEAKREAKLLDDLTTSRHLRQH